MVSKAQFCIYVGKHCILKSSCWYQRVVDGTRSDSPFVYTAVSKNTKQTWGPKVTKPDRVFCGHWVQTQVHLLCPPCKKRVPGRRGALLWEVGPLWGYCLHTTSRTILARVLLTWSGDDATLLYTLVLLCMELKAELGSTQMLILKQ